MTGSRVTYEAEIVPTATGVGVRFGIIDLDSGNSLSHHLTEAEYMSAAMIVLEALEHLSGRLAEIRSGSYEETVEAMRRITDRSGD